MTISPQIMEALNRFDETLRIAIRADTLAECNEATDGTTLRRLRKTWAECKEARIELEALIAELTAKAEALDPERHGAL